MRNQYQADNSAALPSNYVKDATTEVQAKEIAKAGFSGALTSEMDKVSSHSCMHSVDDSGCLGQFLGGIIVQLVLLQDRIPLLTNRTSLHQRLHKVIRLNF
jgi:hypothetical protein